jgi:DsbC/DsbD-like thiol-disulfide interchange protein
MVPMTPATQVSAKHARVELLSRQESAAPGAALLLGVRFILEKGWHIYWVNSGDSGQPPVFKWQLPEGFKAGDIQWPRPERMQSSPMLADYGYHDDVLLLVPVKVAPGIAAGQTAQIILDAKWLICREVCIPDRAQIKLGLPVSRHAQINPANAELFYRTENLLPKPLPRGWKAAVESRKNDFVLAIRAGKPLGKAEFFPLDPDQIDNAAAQRLLPASRGARIVLKKSDLLTKPISKLRGVVVVAGGGAYQVEALVTATKAVQ